MTDFRVSLLSKYENSLILQKIIEISMNRMDDEELGSILDEYCVRRDDGVRQLYNYVDLDKNGFITIEDLQSFLGQVI